MTVFSADKLEYAANVAGDISQAFKDADDAISAADAQQDKSRKAEEEACESPRGCVQTQSCATGYAVAGTKAKSSRSVTHNSQVQGKAAMGTARSWSYAAITTSMTGR